MSDTESIELSIHIAAPPETVYGFFADPERFGAWMGQGCVFEARPGGKVTVRYPNQAPPARGEVVEAEEGRRVVFTWGYEGGANGLPPGASTVSVDLKPHAGGTLLTLRHSDLPTADLARGHLGGWRHYFGVLAWRASHEALSPILEEKVDAWVAAWNEDDGAKRGALLDACWTEDALFVDRMGYVPGRDALDTFIANAHRFMPGVRMARTGPVQEIHGRVRFPWRLDGPDGPVGSGENVGRMNGEGRFLELTGFWATE